MGKVEIGKDIMMAIVLATICCAIVLLLVPSNGL